MIIDIHGHVTSPALLAKYPMPPSLGDIEGMLDQKSELGIGLTCVGTPVGAGTMMRIPGHDNYAQTVDELKAHHEWMAETVATYAPRLRAYAYTNPFGGEPYLAEVARLVRDEGFIGLMVNTSVQDRYLDDPQVDDFWAMANELGVPVFLHPPALPVGSDGIKDMRLVEQVARFCDVTNAIAVLIFSGVLEKYPDLRLIGATAGGATALIASRLDSAYAPKHWGKKADGPPPGAGGPPPGAGGPPPGAGAPPPGAGGPPPGAGGPPPGVGGPPGAGGPPPGAGGPPPWARYDNNITRPPTSFFDQIYVDTANPNGYHQQANAECFGIDRMLFGTDSPPLTSPLENAIKQIEDLPFDDAAKQRIFTDNAKELFDLDV